MMSYCKITFSIIFIAIAMLLPMCSSTDKSTLSLPVWELEKCDTSEHYFENFEAEDVAQVLWQADTLKNKLITIPNIYFIVVKNDTIYKQYGITADSFKAMPRAINPTNSDTLNWLDRSYLWALADQPDYPYMRYIPLLQPIRQTFLAKRDSMIHAYKTRFPQYQLKIQSDLRGHGNQRKYLTMGKSITPLSQHNFGLASDIGIWKNGKQLQNIQHYKAFLGEIGSKYDLTWGGTFLGFIDPNHVQYFKNSAEMLQEVPALRLEFEPYRKYFVNRVKRMTAAGKEAKVEATKALLATLHTLHINKACVCDSLAERGLPTYTSSITNILPAYTEQKDIVLIGDVKRQLVILLHPSGMKKALRVGKWKKAE